MVFTLGPPVAEDSLREAVAWGADEGVLVTDPAFAGSDTLATASALASALRREGPFDLVLVGRNSIDADTGQVGPEVAELLDLPFAAGIRELTLTAQGAEVLCELDDGWREVHVVLPAVLSAAERLTAPSKVAPEGRAAVDPARIRRLSAADLGPGPWGAAGSPTTVGDVRSLEVARHRVVLSGDVRAQVDEAVELLGRWGALDAVRRHQGAGRSTTDAAGGAEPGVDAVPGTSPAVKGEDAPVVAVVVEPDRPRMARELLGEAVHVARGVSGQVVAVGPELAELVDPLELASWGADRVVSVLGTSVEEDMAHALARWCEATPPWAVLVPGTLWGREVAARTAARLGAGLTGDAVGFGVEHGRLVAWKPAFGGALVAAISCHSEVQMATVRPGVLPLRAPRRVGGPVPLDEVAGATRGRVRVVASGRDDDVEALLAARTVVAVGHGVAPEEYGELDPLLKVLGAELGASRKVTDNGWLPRARQIGITGHSVAPALYVAIGVSGKFNHIVGARGAGTIVVINSDPEARIFEWADVAIVGDWHEVVPLLVDALG